MTFKNTNRNTRRNAAFKEERSNPILALAILVGIVVVIGLVGVAMGKELVNTATNKIEASQDMGKLDVLEEIYAELDREAAQTDSTFIVVENDDDSVGLFGIKYPYEDYAETDLPMVELAQYDDLMELWEELN